MPIVYYEGAKKWTVPSAFRSRIIEGDLFGKYIPDFEYYLVPLRQYSNEELLAKKDEISFVMLINRMRDEDDIEVFRNLSVEKVEEILKETPAHLLDIISNILRAFLLRMNLPEEETEELVGKVKEKKMGYLFEDMTLDIQKIRREAEATKKEAEAIRQEGEALKQEGEALRQESEALRQESELLKQEALQIIVEAYQELGISRQDIIKKVAEKFGMEIELVTEILTKGESS